MVRKIFEFEFDSRRDFDIIINAWDNSDGLAFIDIYNCRIGFYNIDDAKTFRNCVWMNHITRVTTNLVDE